VKEGFVEKRTLGAGSAWDIAFSKDPKQTYIYLADGENDRIHILLRDTLEVLTTFGEGGRQPGEFYGPHSVATDQRVISMLRRRTEASACRSSSIKAWRR
jgi:hypothetical protein